MKNYKYYIKVTDRNGHVIFDRKANSEKWLINLYRRNAYVGNGTGDMLSIYYTAEVETNIQNEIDYETYCTEKAKALRQQKKEELRKS